jgi:DNA-directed RNA polymerase specialized sigma24 family protein
MEGSIPEEQWNDVWPRIRNFVLKRAKRWSLPFDDALQDAAEHLLKMWKSYNPEKGPWHTYAFVGAREASRATFAHSWSHGMWTVDMHKKRHAKGVNLAQDVPCHSSGGTDQVDLLNQSQISRGVSNLQSDWRASPGAKTALANAMQELSDIQRQALVLRSCKGISFTRFGQLRSASNGKAITRQACQYNTRKAAQVARAFMIDAGFESLEDCEL